MPLPSGRRMRALVYAATFFYTVHYAFTLYINSSFLGKYIDTPSVGVLYGIGSALAILLLSQTSAILARFGQFKTTIAFLVLNILALLGIALWDSTIAVLALFLLYYLATIFLRLDLDVYLEKYSRDEETGAFRGVFLTVLNIAIFISPFLVGLILTNGEFHRVYLVAAALIVPTALIIMAKLRDVPDVAYRVTPFGAALARLARNRNLASIFGATFLLEFFYSWMVIYAPIYLNRTIGFSWGEIGAIFSIMLLPFVLFQYPLGRLADRVLGEKEILTGGLIIMGLSTMVLAFISEQNFWLWAGMLFLTRTGASAVEIMNESYFFKHVAADDTDIISVYRDSRPLAYIAGPLAGSLVVATLPYNMLFLILGGLMLLGITFSLALVDTR